jgi:hypothetical protein
MKRMRELAVLGMRTDILAVPAMSRVSNRTAIYEGPS